METFSPLQKLNSILDYPFVSVDITPYNISGIIFRLSAANEPQIITRWCSKIEGDIHHSLKEDIRKHSLQGHPIELSTSGPNALCRILSVSKGTKDVYTYIERRIPEIMPQGLDVEEVIWTYDKVWDRQDPNANEDIYAVSLFRKKELEDIAQTIAEEKCIIRSLRAGLAHLSFSFKSHELKSPSAILISEDRFSRLLLFLEGKPFYYCEISLGILHSKEDPAYFHTEIEKATDLYLQIHKQMPKIKNFVLLNGGMEVYKAHLEKIGYAVTETAKPDRAFASAALLGENVPSDLPGNPQQKMLHLNKSKRQLMGWSKKTLYAACGLGALLLVAQLVVLGIQFKDSKQTLASTALLEKYKENQEELIALQSRYSSFFDALSKGSNFPITLEFIGSTLPDKVWLGGINISNKSNGASVIELVGYTEEAKQIGTFIQKLEKDNRVVGVKQRFTEIMDKSRVAKLSNNATGNKELTKFKLQVECK